MAIKTQADAVKGLTADIALPMNRYQIRCTHEEFGMSKSSENPMITREWEIVAPEIIEVGGQKVAIAGTTVQQYLTVKVNGDPEKSAKALGRLFEDYKKLGFPCNEIDDENPELHAEGIVAEAILGSDSQTMRQTPTEEQKVKRELGEPILDANGKEIVIHRAKLVMILGLCQNQAVKSAAANRPY